MFNLPPSPRWTTAIHITSRLRQAELIARKLSVWMPRPAGDLTGKLATTGSLTTLIANNDDPWARRLGSHNFLSRCCTRTAIKVSSHNTWRWVILSNSNLAWEISFIILLDFLLSHRIWASLWSFSLHFVLLVVIFTCSWLQWGWLLSPRRRSLCS